MGSYVMLPVEVPDGTTQVRVKYCWEGGGNTVDLGIWQAHGVDAVGRRGVPRLGRLEPPGRRDLGAGLLERGGVPRGSAGLRARVAPRAASCPDRSWAGTWAVELGVGAVAEADADQLADFRVEIELSNDPAFAADPYVPADYDTTPADANPGWYAGDVHVHAEHSALGDATMTEVFDYAFASLDDGGAGLDFITLSDYVSRSAWDEIGRYQPPHPGKLVIRSAEIITYHGHAMNHGSVHYVDHRAGPVYRVAANGDLTLLRATHPPAEMFAAIHDAGGVTQLNHVTTCPSNTEYCRRTCRGCPWDWNEADTDFSKVDAIEVQSGSFFKYELFTAAAIAFWDLALAQGHQIAAVGLERFAQRLHSSLRRTRFADRGRDHRRLRRVALRVGDPRRHPRRSHLREALRQRRSRPATRCHRRRGRHRHHGRHDRRLGRDARRDGLRHRCPASPRTSCGSIATASSSTRSSIEAPGDSHAFRARDAGSLPHPARARAAAAAGSRSSR